MAGPYTLWSGKTADRRYRVEVVERSGKQSVRIDGREGAAFDAVDSRSLAFSADGKHIAFAARRNGAWLVVRDGQPGPEWDAIGEVVLSSAGDGLAYAAESAGRWHAVRGNRPGPGFDALLSGTLRFSEDGHHLAYVASDREKSRVVIDDALGPAFDGVGRLQLSNDGSHRAYAARIGTAGYVVLDGVARGPWSAVDEIVLGRYGRLAYLARSGDDMFVHRSRLDGEGFVEAGPYRAAFGLILSADEQHAAWVVRMGSDEAIVVDGQPFEGRYSSIVPHSLALRSLDGEPVFIARDANASVHAVIGKQVGPPYDDIEGEQIEVSADGRHVAYSGRRGGRSVVVIDGAEQPTEEWAGRPVFDAQGKRFAYLATRKRRSVVVVAGRSYDLEVAIEGTLAFSKDGLHWSCLAGSAKERSFYFVVDGRRRSGLDLEELVSTAQRISFDEVVQGRAGHVLRAWAAAEAELASAPLAGAGAWGRDR
jgi:hypothetical protein